MRLDKCYEPASTNTCMKKLSRQALREIEREEQRQLKELKAKWNDPAKLETYLRDAFKVATLKPAVKAKPNRTVPCPARLSEIFALLDFFPLTTNPPRQQPTFSFGMYVIFLEGSRLKGNNPSRPACEDDLDYEPLSGEERKRIWELAKGRSLQGWYRFVVDLSIWKRCLEWVTTKQKDDPRSPEDSISVWKLPGRISVDRERRIRFLHHEAVLTLEGVPVNRIKKCRHCGRLFWAGRIDKPTCSVKCGNSWRQQKFRAAKEKYKRNRIRAADLKDIRKKGGKK